MTLEIRTVPAALKQAAGAWGNRAAYVEGGGAREAITWAELARRAEDVAAGLVVLGLKRGDRIAICGQNSIDWIVACQATVAAGASVVPVYYEQTAGEIVEQVARPGCRFLFASQRVLGGLQQGHLTVEQTIFLDSSPEERGKALTLDGVAQMATEEARELLLANQPGPEDLAAIIYTSGTTGGPKGVMLSHRNIVAGAQSAAEAMALDFRDSALLVLPLHHSLAFVVAAVLPALIGGKIVIENDMRRIRDRLGEWQPTIFLGVPALFELIYRSVVARAESEGRLDHLKRAQAGVRLIKRITGINVGPLVFRSIHSALGGRIRFLVSGAAALKPQTALDYFSLGLPLLQGAGVTEASSAIAVQRFSRWRFLFTRYYERHAGSIGQPLPSVEVRLIDVPDKDIRVDQQGEGELVVRGPNVFTGYWQAPEATKAAVEDGWLHTGDLARIDRDGSIFLTGRAKYVIVLDSGEKVHPDEIEDKLGESGLIEDVCVTGRRLREKVVVTAIVYANVEAVLEQASNDASEPDGVHVETVISREVDRLSKELADYKRVGRIELSDEPLPKTALRKVARGRLAETYSFDYSRWLRSATTPANVNGRN